MLWSWLHKKKRKVHSEEVLQRYCLHTVWASYLWTFETRKNGTWPWNSACGRGGLSFSNQILSLETSHCVTRGNRSSDAYDQWVRSTPIKELVIASESLNTNNPHSSNSDITHHNDEREMSLVLGKIMLALLNMIIMFVIMMIMVISCMKMVTWPCNLYLIRWTFLLA